MKTIENTLPIILFLILACALTKELVSLNHARQALQNQLIELTKGK